MKVTKNENETKIEIKDLQKTKTKYIEESATVKRCQYAAVSVIYRHVYMSWVNYYGLKVF